MQERTIYFYSEKEENGQLSNYAALKTPIYYDGKSYATSEHLYQALKFLGSESSEVDREYAEVIRLASTPNKAKILGTQCRRGGYKWRLALNAIILQFKERGARPRVDWDDVKLEKMLLVLRKKYAQDQKSRNALLATEDAILVENSSSDAFWGNGGASGKGANHLGRLLMQVREESRVSHDLTSQPTTNCRTADKK